LPAGDPILKYSPHFDGEGRIVFESARKLGAEGIVSKRRDGHYIAGRSDQWLKTKSLQRQEFVIGGFTLPEGTRTGIGSLLLGVYEDDRFVYAGKVGTGKGWTADYLAEVRRGLETIAQSQCPYTVPPPPPIPKTARWVKPLLVAEVAFVEWTSDGSIRHPSFQGFRADKDARAVKRERPESRPSQP
jgi:bifunctional non-homologous end joining protein LigD